MDIVVRQLVKNYQLGEETIHVLHGVDWEIASGEFVSLTGTSGVGKSTLLHLLGLLDNATSGMISLNNVVVDVFTSSEKAHFRNQNIGFVFQFHHLLPELTALENVEIPLLIRRCSVKEAKERAQYWLEAVGLSHRLHHQPGELSGGEQQRVALARALVAEPKLLLADEPTGNLDERTGNEIFDLMRSISRNKKVTTIIVTHNSRLAEKADKQYSLTQEGLSLL